MNMQELSESANSILLGLPKMETATRDEQREALMTIRGIVFTIRETAKRIASGKDEGLGVNNLKSQVERLRPFATSKKINSLMEAVHTAITKMPKKEGSHGDTSKVITGTRAVLSPALSGSIKKPTGERVPVGRGQKVTAKRHFHEGDIDQIFEMSTGEGGIFITKICKRKLFGSNKAVWDAEYDAAKKLMYLSQDKQHNKNLVRIVGCHKGSDAQPPEINMEDLRQLSLAQLLADNPNGLKPKAAVDITLGIAKGLHEAQTARVIHTNLKPSQIFVVGNESQGLVAKVADFANRKKGTRAANEVTNPGYSAPEQPAGRTGPESDIWALGILFLQLLSGALPVNPNTPCPTGKHPIFAPWKKGLFAGLSSNNAHKLATGMLNPNPDLRINLPLVINQLEALQNAL
jgi:hypothetical protein